MQCYHYTVISAEISSVVLCICAHQAAFVVLCSRRRYDSYGHRDHHTQKVAVLMVFYVGPSHSQRPSLNDGTFLFLVILVDKSQSGKKVLAVGRSPEMVDPCRAPIILVSIRQRRRAGTAEREGGSEGAPFHSSSSLSLSPSLYVSSTHLISSSSQ